MSAAAPANALPRAVAPRRVQRRRRGHERALRGSAPPRFLPVGALAGKAKGLPRVCHVSQMHLKPYIGLDMTHGCPAARRSRR